MNKELEVTLDSLMVIHVMKKSIERFEHKFKGFGIHDSLIRVHIFSYGDQRIVVMEDLGEGTSVTNASEQLASEIGRLKNLDPKKTTWMECYPYISEDWDIDQITYDYSNGQYSNPNWKPIKNRTIVNFLKSNL